MTWLLRWLGLEGEASVQAVLESSWHLVRPLPGWVLAVLILVGLALALVNFHPSIGMRRSVRLWTFLLRLGVMGLLLVILLGVQWRGRLALDEPQRWTVLIDDSASMSTADGDSAETRYQRAMEDWRAIREKLGSGLELAAATFSEQPLDEETAGQGPTRFRDAVHRAALRQHRLDRLVVLTDGRDSEARDLTRLGKDLRARGVELSVAVYGERVARPNAGLTAEPERGVIRLGEELRISGRVLGVEAGDRVVLLKEDGKKVSEHPAPAAADHRFTIGHRPEKAGEHTYTLELPDARDPVRENNRVSFTVRVVDQKIQVLMIEGFPRFEFKLYKAVLEVDPMVDLVTISHLPGGGGLCAGRPAARQPRAGLDYRSGRAVQVRRGDPAGRAAVTVSRGRGHHRIAAATHRELRHQAGWRPDRHRGSERVSRRWLRKQPPRGDPAV